MKDRPGGARRVSGFYYATAANAGAAFMPRPQIGLATTSNEN
ncbi:MAG TPA: hypothetical protein VGD81_02470 [Opitutaceae bacterium]